MNSPRLRKENNECQTDLQCTPFILNENETGKVQSSRLCQTEVQLSPLTPDTELYKKIPYINDEDIEKNAVRFMSVIRNRNIKLQFILPSDTSSENDDLSSTNSDDLNEKSDDDVYRYTNEPSYKKENKKPKIEIVDSGTSSGTLKSAIKKIRRDDDSTQTDLMVAPHVLYNKEKATITIHNSCQTSLTCTPRTSLTEVVPMLKSYWEHQGEIREAFNKSENVLEILKEVIKDVIDIHQHMFDPNYNLPDMSTALVKLEPSSSLADSTDWDVLSNSKRMKRTIMDVGGDGSFGNTTLSDYKDDDYKHSAITSSTLSDITTSFSSDYTLASTKDDESDVELDDDAEISEILSNLKKKYTSPVDGNSEKTLKGVTTDDDESPKCQMINSSCVCSGINIKLYFEDEFDKDNDDNKIDRFIEMKIKPDLETIEIQKLVNISADPESAKIRTTIPFQEIEKLIRGDQSNNDGIEKLAKLFSIEDQKEPLKINTLKSDGFQININIPKSSVLKPQTSSEDLLQTFLFANLSKDLENAPHPDMLDKVSFPNQAKGCMNIDDNKDNNQMQICPCDMPTDPKPVSETQSAFTAVFSRLYGDTEKLIPFHMDEPACECNYDAKDSEQEQLEKNTNLDKTAHILNKGVYFEPEINKNEDKGLLIAKDPDEDIANNLMPNKQGVVIIEDSYGTSIVSYNGHIYHTDNVLLSCNSDDSLKSSATNVVITPVRRKSKKQTIIAYEEQMYKTDLTAPLSETSSLECTCATKLKGNLRECSHCFKRIGPQYGRDRYRQSSPEQNKYRSCALTSSTALSETEKSTLNNTCHSKHNHSDHTNFNLKETANSKSSKGGIIEYNDSIERNSNTGEIYSTKCNTIKENVDISKNLRRYVDSTDRDRDVAGIVKQSADEYCKSADEYCKSANRYGKSADEYGKSGGIDTPSLAKMIPDKNDEYKGTTKTKCQTCPKAKRNKKLLMNPLQVTSPSANIIADKNEKHITKSIAKCETCSKAKLNKTCSKNLTTAYDTPSLDKIIAEMEENYIAISKAKCQTCSKTKLNDASKNNLKIVKIYETRSTCSSEDQLVEKRGYAATFNNFTCSATRNKSNNSSGIVLEEKIPIVNLQKLMQMEEKLRSQQNKNNAQDSRKNCLSHSRISTTTMNQDNSWKSSRAPKSESIICSSVKGKCDLSQNKEETVGLMYEECTQNSARNNNATCAANKEKSMQNICSQIHHCNLEVIYPPKSESLNCTSIKSKCDSSHNKEEKASLMDGESTQNSIKNNYSTCEANKETSVQNISSLIHHSKLKFRLENITQCRQKNAEYPRTPSNSIRSNCKCSNCIFYNDLNEFNKSGHSSQCQKLTHCSIQKILEKNLPCSCTPSSTNQKEDNLGTDLDYLSFKQNIGTSKSSNENVKDKIQETIMLPEEIMSASDSESKIKQNDKYSTANIIRLMKEETMFKNDIVNTDMLSNLSITIQPKVQILNAPKYTYKIYNCALNGEFILDTNNNEKIFYYNSLDNFSCAKSVDLSREEFLLANVTKSDTHINDELKKSYFSSKTTKNKSKILHIHELEGKYSVFSIEKKNKSNESQNTVYILPNAIFSSYVSTPPPEFLRELTESQIDDIIHFSHIRKIHYERNPEFDQETNATMSSNNNSEQLVNTIANNNNNLPSMRQTTCSCSLSVPRNQEQQTDEIFNDIKADKATLYTSLQKTENKVHNSVGIQNLYLLFDSSQPENTVSSFQKQSFETNEFPKVDPNDDNVKVTENTSHKRESNSLHTLGKYITWDDLMKPKLYNPTPVQNAITSLEPLITRTNQKEDRSNQTSNLSFLNLLSEPSFKSPLTIEASTSTDYLEVEGSMITSPGYHLSDYSVTTKRRLLQTPSVRAVLKKTIFPTLTLEASTSTKSTNKEQKIFTPSSTKKSISLANVSLLDENLNEKETTPTSKYEESTFKSPTKETLSSTFQNTALERSSLIHEAPTIKIPTYIGIPLPSSPNIASPCINSLPESFPGLLEKSHETSINDMPPFTSLIKFTLSNRPVLQEPNLQSVDNYAQISLTKDQISCISLPKVESLYSISESNCLMTDTDTNFTNNDLNHQEWSYPQEKETHNSRKFIHGTGSPASELFMHSTENVLISVNSKHNDTSVSKNHSPLQHEAVLKPESAKDINKQDSSIFELYSSTDLKSKEVFDDKSFDTKLFSNNTPKLNSLEPSITSDKNYIHFGSSILNEDHKLSSSTNENYHKVGFKKYTKYNEELKDSPLNTSTSTLQEEPENKFHENMRKNLQIERLLSKAIDAYGEYVTLKKGISSKFNISKIDLVYPDTDSHDYSKYTEEGIKDILKNNQPIQLLTDSLTSKSDDYNFDYLKTKDSNLDYIQKCGKNSLKLSDTSVEPDKIHNSSEEFLAQTEKAYSQILQQKKESSKISKISVLNSYSSSENSSKDLQTNTNLTKKSSSYQCPGEDFLFQIEKAYSKVLQRKEEFPKLSLSNIYSSFENSSKDLQTETNPTKKSSSFQYSLSSDASSIIDFKQDSFSSKTSEQDTEFSSLKKDQTTNVKSNLYKDILSDKFLLKKDNNGSATSKGEEEISNLNRDLHKTKEDANIKSDNSEIVENKSQVYTIDFKNNPSLFMFENNGNLRRSEQEKNKFLSPLSSVNDNNLAQNSLALRESSYKDVIVNQSKDDHGKINKDSNEINLKKTNLSFQYSNNVKPNTSKHLKLETFMYNPKDNSAYTALEKELSEKITYRKVATPYQSSRGSTELKTNDYPTYAKKEEFISPIQSTSTFSATYLHSISENRNSLDLKSNDYSTYSKKENNVYPRKSTSKIDAPYSNYGAETINSTNLKSYNSSTYPRKEETVSPGISTYENASLYPHVDDNRSRNLKLNNFSTYPKKEETISSSSKRASFYLPNVVGSKNFTNLKSKDFSTYPKNEETLSTRIFIRQSPHNIVEVKSGRNIKPNNYSTYPKQEEATSPIQSTSIFEPTTSHSISENKNDYSTNTRKTETFSSRRPSLNSALAYPYSDLDNRSSSNIKSNDYSTYQKKEETSPIQGTSNSAPTYPHNISEHKSYKNLKLNDYSSYSKKEETCFPRVPTLQNASFYPPSISENRSYLNLDFNNYSTYPRKDETFSSRRSNYKNALAYPHSDLESRNLKSNDNSTYFSSGRSNSKSALVYPYSNLDNSSSRNLKSNDYSTNRKKDGSIPPIQGSIIFPPIYPHFISENKSYRDLKSIENSKYSKKEQIYSPRMSIVQNDSLHPHSGLENRSSINLKSNQHSAHSRIEESFSSRRPNFKSVLDFSRSELENRSSKDLKSNDYPTYPIKEEIITSRRLNSKSVLPNPHSILKIKSSRNLISNDYSTFPEEEEEDTSPIISAPQSTLYPYSIKDKRSSRILNSNEFIYKPESQSKIPEIENDLLNSVVNNNTANMNNSATSKLSLFVRNGEVSELLSNSGDSTQQLPPEKLDHIRPDVAVSGHRVLEAVRSCGQRLQPIKIALKNIKMQLKELNMPEVNDMLETDHLADENKTYIYLPPPPAPWVGNRCTYRTKMTFQLKQPIKPVSVTENVNAFSIKHKYILNDAERNHVILNANYSSLSDPSHHVQRKSIDSISPNFNQASYSESKPMHSSRYHPDTYYERSHTIRNPLKIIEEDPSLYAEDLKCSRRCHRRL